MPRASGPRASPRPGRPSASPQSPTDGTPDHTPRRRGHTRHSWGIRAAGVGLPGPIGTLFEYRGDASLAILASVGEIDPLGTRREGLAAFLDQKVEEGYVIETRTDTHAIISRRPRGLKRFTSGADPGRYVVEVDENGIATMRPAEPRRT